MRSRCAQNRGASPHTASSERRRGHRCGMKPRRGLPFRPMGRRRDHTAHATRPTSDHQHSWAAGQPPTSYTRSARHTTGLRRTGVSRQASAHDALVVLTWPPCCVHEMSRGLRARVSIPIPSRAASCVSRQATLAGKAAGADQAAERRGPRRRVLLLDAMSREGRTRECKVLCAAASPRATRLPPRFCDP